MRRHESDRSLLCAVGGDAAGNEKNPKPVTENIWHANPWLIGGMMFRGSSTIGSRDYPYTPDGIEALEPENAFDSGFHISTSLLPICKQSNGFAEIPRGVFPLSSAEQAIMLGIGQLNPTYIFEKYCDQLGNDWSPCRFLSTTTDFKTCMEENANMYSKFYITQLCNYCYP